MNATSHRHLIALVLFLLLNPAWSTALRAQTVQDRDVDSIVYRLSDMLETSYPFPELSARYKQLLHDHLRAGNYRNLSEKALAQKLTEDLQTVHKDRHLVIFRDSIAYTAATAVVNPDIKPDESSSEPKSLSYSGNYGFDKVEIDHYLSIAYISTPGPWYAEPEAFNAATAAMALASGSRHIIIDVRRNGGGSGAIGRFLASYFYRTGDDQYYLYGFRKDKQSGVQEWTLPFVPGKTVPDAKLYILTGNSTGSAAEGFAFAMQQLKRGIVIGDTTAGAGIAGSMQPLKSNLMLFLPVKMIVAPHSDKGWEGDGVIPEIAGKQDALVIAKRMILQEQLGAAKEEAQREVLNWELDNLVWDKLQPIEYSQYPQLMGTYAPNVSIRKKDGKLVYRVSEDKQVKDYPLLGVKPDVLVIKGLNPDLGDYSSRLYISRNAAGDTVSISRKTYIASQHEIFVGNTFVRKAKK